jgi:site-specific recombinase XerD
LKGKRDRALLALLLARGLRRHEAVSLRIHELQQREEHWALVDLVGKAGHIRTVPIPDCVMAELDQWLRAAEIERGRIFRKVKGDEDGQAVGRMFERKSGLARLEGLQQRGLV